MSFKEISPGVYLVEVDGLKRLATLQAAPGSVYGERIVDGYRLWDPHRSKLAALILKGERIDILRDARVLYLGAATGTTVSHVSDIAREGLVYAIEFSPRSMRDLVKLCDARENIIPILADAAQPQDYSPLVEPVDLIYQDVAQRNQTEIASANARRYLKDGGRLVLMMKTRSIDVTAVPKEVLQSEIGGLQGLDVLGIMDLQPYHRDHWAVVARKPEKS